MTESITRIATVMLGYAQRLLSDIPADRWAEQPQPGINHPAWIVGHLALSADSCRQMLGLPRNCPTEWKTQFGGGSQVTNQRTDYPTCEVLMAALLTNSQQLIEAYSHASPEVLGEPHPAPRFREELPTKGDLIGFVMTSHFTLHLGQLSMWRRLVGFAPLF